MNNSVWQVEVSDSPRRQVIMTRYNVLAKSLDEAVEKVNALEAEAVKELLEDGWENLKPAEVCGIKLICTIDA